MCFDFYPEAGGWLSSECLSLLVLDNNYRFYIDGHFLVSFPDPPVNENPDWEGFGEFGAPWEISGTHPWGDSLLAPFDKEV